MFSNFFFQFFKIIWTLKIFDNFSNWTISKIWLCVNWIIFRMLQFEKLTNFLNFFDLVNYRRFSYLSFDINWFWRFIFLIFIFHCRDPRKFDRLHIWTFVNFQIQNVNHSKMLLFEILTFILRFNIRTLHCGFHVIFALIVCISLYYTSLHYLNP